MTESEEDIALAILFANTKRKKRRVDLLTIAKSCEYLVKLYGSKEEVAKKIGISSSMIRQLLTPLKLSENIQLLIQNRDIDSIEIVNQIATIKDPNAQLSFVENLENVMSEDSRDIKRILKKSDLSTTEARKTIIDQKPKKVHFFIIDLDDDEYNSIIKKSYENGIEPATFVKRIVSNGLKRNGEFK